MTEGQVGKLVEKEKLTAEQGAEQVERTLSLITGTTAYDGFGDVDFVIEAVPEKMEIKHAVFAELDAATPGHAILASNTSGLSITEIGDATNRPDKVVGFHFFWPASFMRLIEIVEGEDTSQDDAPGRRQLRPGDPQDARCAAPSAPASSSTASSPRPRPRSGATRTRRASPAEELDAHITEAAGMPMGPFRVADMSGLDTVAEGRARHARRLRRPLLRPRGHGGARRARRPRRQDREGLL